MLLTPPRSGGIAAKRARGGIAAAEFHDVSIYRATMLGLAFAVGAAAELRAQPPAPPLPPLIIAGPTTLVPLAEEPQVGTKTVPLANETISTDAMQQLSDPKTAPLAFPSPNRLLEEQLDLKVTMQIRGRIETEAVFAAQSAQSKMMLGDLQNGYGFRRVRLGAQGSIGDAASWVSEVELAGGSVRIRDVFVGLDALPGVRQIRVGYFREPYSLEGMTSSNFITFLERSALNNLSPARNWGVCGYWWTEEERVLSTFGVFRDNTSNTGQSTGDGDNWAYTGRITGLPIYEDEPGAFRLIHLGGAFSQRVPLGGVINFSPRTASNLLTVEDTPSSPFLPSVNVPANSYQLYNLQAAGVRGPFSVQSEWMAAAVQQTDAGTIFVHGVYIYGSYFLTGEHRGYNRTRGSFDQVAVRRPLLRTRTDPRSGFGAVELAMRIAYLDFNSPNLPLDVNGLPAQTDLYELTLGANWYLNSFTRIMFNYTVGMPDKVGFGETSAHIFGIRAALYW